MNTAKEQRTTSLVQNYLETGDIDTQIIEENPAGSTDPEVTREQNIQENLSLAKRYNLFPIRDQEAYEDYVQLEATFWTAFELRYADDKKDYNKLREFDATGFNAKAKRLIDCSMMFLLPGDGLVTDNLIDYFMKHAKNFEERIFFAAQIHNEIVHAITYALMGYTMYTEEELKEMLEAVDNIPCIKAQVELMEKYLKGGMDGTYTLAEMYVAFAAAEGILFMIIFIVIFWFKSVNLFKNFIAINRMVNRDEGKHRDFGCKRYKKIPASEKSPTRSLEIIQEFVAVQRMFIEYMVPEPVLDLDAVSLNTCLEAISDNLLVKLGLQKHYFPEKFPKLPTWFDISLLNKENFFELITVGYKRFDEEKAMHPESYAVNDDEEDVNFLQNTEDADF